MTKPGDLHVVDVIAAAIAALYLVQGASAQAWTSFVTKAVFDQKLFPDHIAFYSYEALKAASNSKPGFGAFGSSGNLDDRKRELAAFLAHVNHESGGLTKKYEENIVPKNNRYCNTRYTKFPCAAGKRYIGRGALQLTWNYNYGGCSRYLNLERVNLLKDPGLALRDGKTSFQTALWFWMINVGLKGITPHEAILKRSFSGTIQAINGNLECSGKGQTANGRQQQKNRVAYYKDFCKKLGVQPGTDLTC